jgi:pimeloyl-ACP methyl ester carboxylesterase
MSTTSTYAAKRAQGIRRESCAGADFIADFNRLDKGGHFAAWELPQLFAQEVRAGFRSLRN